MRDALVGVIVLSLLISQGQVLVPGNEGNSSQNSISTQSEHLEETVTIRGTNYHVSVYKENHTVKVSATHFASNTTPAGFSVELNGAVVINEGWRSSEGDEITITQDLMPYYKSDQEVQNISFGTYGGSVNLSYNFTVPRKHEGRYLRPTITDVSFDRVNESWGRMTVTLQSDSRYYYHPYVRVWTPDVNAKQVDLFREKGENVSTASILLPVEEGEPIEGELRLYPRHLNGSGPLHTQYEFYGKPGDSSLSEVPYQPLSDREVLDTYEYRNESATKEDSRMVSGAQYRTAIGLVAVALIVVLVGAVLISKRRSQG